VQARAIFRVSRSVEAVAVEAEEPVEAAEARAERLTRKFAHEAKAAADDGTSTTRSSASMPYPCSGSGSSRRTNRRRARRREPRIRPRCASLANLSPMLPTRFTRFKLVPTSIILYIRKRRERERAGARQRRFVAGCRGGEGV
jgi:hypothetical protein